MIGKQRWEREELPAKLTCFTYISFYPQTVFWGIMMPYTDKERRFRDLNKLVHAGKNMVFTPPLIHPHCGASWHGLLHCKTRKSRETRTLTCFYYFQKCIVVQIQLSCIFPFTTLPSPPLPHSLPTHCPCPWVPYSCSIPPLFPHYPLLLPSHHCQFVLYFHDSGSSLLFVLLIRLHL